MNNAGVFYKKPFTDFTAEDFTSLFSTNLLGFLYITQLTVKRMLRQQSGSVVSITAALADQGGTITGNVIDNAVAPGVVQTPLHKESASDCLGKRQPNGRVAEVKDVVDAVLYLTEADQVTGEVLHVDGGAHAGCW